MSNKPIKVMVVEDSAYIRYVISEILESDPGITVIEKARDGVDALEKLRRSIPDVITLDIQMPNMDGLKFLEEMRKDYKIPTIMISSLTVEGAEDTIKALALGAVDFVPKPSGVLNISVDQMKDEIIAKVKMASEMKAVVLSPHEAEEPEQPKSEESAQAAEAGTAATPRRQKLRQKSESSVDIAEIQLRKIVAVGCSTGGPRALTEIVPILPADLPACIIVVQHMPAKFTTSLAERLDSVSAIEVKEAANGDKIRPGIVYIAPGDFHIQAGKGDVLYLNQEPPQHGVRPSVNVLMKSVARMYGERAIGVILTGMGTDGCEGVAEIKENGGYVFAEHERSCVVYGMPRAAVESGNVDRVLILPRIADELVNTIFA